MPRLVSTLALLALTGFASAAATIGPTTICGAYESRYNTLIFRGRVANITPVPSTYSERLRVIPIEVFKGDPGHEITVTQMDDGQSSKTVGHEYLFFGRANPNTGEYWLGGQDIQKVDPGDLAWLRAYATASPAIRIFGKFSYIYTAANTADASVTLVDGDNRQRSATPDNTGQYSFDGLPSGTYTLLAHVPDNLTAAGSQELKWTESAVPDPVSRSTQRQPLPPPGQVTVTVAPKSCTEVDWDISPNNRIEGTVVDASGNPLPHTMVNLMQGNATDQALARGRYPSVNFQSTDERGKFSFAGLPPADYRLALNESAPDHALVLYPEFGAPVPVLHVGPTAKLDNIRLVQSQPYSPVTVHVHIMRSNGSPIDGAKIYAINPAQSTLGFAAKADFSGTGDLHLFAGVEYTITAETPQPGPILVPATETSPVHLEASPIQQEQPVCAGPIEIVASDNLTIAGMVPDKSQKECRSAPPPWIAAQTPR